MKHLTEDQLDAIEHMHNGCILKGEPGVGKSFTALAYFFKVCGGDISNLQKPCPKPMDLLIITTAKKRDSKDWIHELEDFNTKGIHVIVDSWNNIEKYKKTFKNGFAMFDEQRAVSNGPWSKSFIEISKHNNWILLSATPGDKWTDYISVFIANGFYKSKSDFERQHVMWARFTNYPKISGYMHERVLYKLRDSIIVDIDCVRDTVQHHENIECKYDKILYKETMRTRWNVYKNEPIRDAAGLCYVLRRVVNESPDRKLIVEDLVKKHKKVIIFYNFNYELDILLNLDYGPGFSVAQWNGHKHEEIPNTDRWVYLVQYIAGAEGWNCITTDTIIFFSQSYSYKVMKQASGRIDRRNTKFRDLYYYHLQSKSNIDLAIRRALETKKEFNENKFVSRLKGEWACTR